MLCDSDEPAKGHDKGTVMRKAPEEKGKVLLQESRPIPLLRLCD
jgi:hypothetical protein